MSPQLEMARSTEAVFADLIAPITEEVFFRDYWEKQPLVSRGRPADFFVPLFSIRDVDKLIAYTKPKSGWLDLVSAQGFVADNYLNADGTASVNLVRESYLKGSTIILSGLEQVWEPLVVLAARIEAQLSHPVAMAVYLTPPNFQGVKPHFDTQENFLLQVEGTKSWKVYKPLQELPPVEGSYSPVERERLSEPICETVLHPGEVLYIPRGFVHEGIAGDQPSLHITVDIHVRTWLDFFSDALAAMAQREPRFRRSLPAGFLNSEEGMQLLDSEFHEFLDLFRDRTQLSDAVSKHAEVLAVKKPPAPDGHFAVLHADIHAHTRLKKRQTTLNRVFEENGMAGMQFSGNHIVGPAKIAGALKYIAHSDTLTPASLPGPLTENEKIVLVRRLVRIGLLTLD